MQRLLQILEHYMVQYLIVGVFGVAAAYLFFRIGGSFAEVTGQQNTVADVSFKAGGALAGFLIIFVLSVRVIGKLRDIEQRSKLFHLRLHLIARPRFRPEGVFACHYSLYNEETGTRRVFPAEVWWDAGQLTITVRDASPTDLIGVRIQSGNQVWESGFFPARERNVEMASIAQA